MEAKNILQNLKDEKSNLFIEFTNNKIPMTELAIQYLVRLRAITRVERELGESDKKIIIKNFKIEKDQLSKIMLDDRSPISPTFMEQVHRLKIITQVINDLDGLQDPIKEREKYIG